MTNSNLDKKLEEAKFALDAKFKKFQEEKRLKEEAANKKDDEKRTSIHPEYTYKKPFPTAKVLSAIGGLALLVTGVIYRNDIGNYFKSLSLNSNRNTIAYVDPVQSSQQNVKLPSLNEASKELESPKNETPPKKATDIPRNIRKEYIVQSGTYYLNHSINVKTDGKLTLSKGVVINFKNSYNDISINGGLLNILGTKNDPVIIDAQQDPMNGTETEYWDGITLENTKKDNTIENAIIRHVKDDKGGIHTITSKLRLSQSTIEQCVITKDIGGGMLNENNSDITIDGCIITDNHGIGICNLNSTISIIGNSIISKNVSGSEGGGLYNKFSIVKILSGQITENQAKFGAGMYNVNSSIELENTKIIGNAALRRGGGIYSEKSKNKYKDVTIINNTASGIELLGIGKNLYERGESIYKDSESSWAFVGKNNKIDNNNLDKKAAETIPKIVANSGTPKKKPPIYKNNNPSTPISTIKKTENTTSSSEQVIDKPKDSGIVSVSMDEVKNAGGSVNEAIKNKYNQGNTNTVAYTPIIGHTYSINDSTFYYNNPVIRNGNSYYFILSQTNCPPIPRIISAENLTYMYNNGRVQDLGNQGRREVINQMQEQMKLERRLRH